MAKYLPASGKSRDRKTGSSDLGTRKRRVSRCREGTRMLETQLFRVALNDDWCKRVVITLLTRRI